MPTLLASRRPLADKDKRASLGLGQRRSLCPMINHALIQVAETGDLSLLCQAVERYFDDMNLVNLTTALHRLAKLCQRATKRFEPESLEHQVAVLLLARTSELLDPRQNKDATQSRCQTVVNIAWSLSVLQCCFELGSFLGHLADSIVRFAQTLLRLFTASELAMLLDSLGELACNSAQAFGSVSGFFKSAADPLMRKIPELRGVWLITLLAAYARVRVLDLELLLMLSEHIDQRLQDAKGRWCSGEKLAAVVRALEIFDFRHAPLLRSVSRCAAERGLQWEDLSAIAMGLSRLKFVYPEALQRQVVLRMATKGVDLAAAAAVQQKLLDAPPEVGNAHKDQELAPPPAPPRPPPRSLLWLEPPAAAPAAAAADAAGAAPPRELKAGALRASALTSWQPCTPELESREALASKAQAEAGPAAPAEAGTRPRSAAAAWLGDLDPEPAAEPPQDPCQAEPQAERPGVTAGGGGRRGLAPEALAAIPRPLRAAAVPWGPVSQVSHDLGPAPVPAPVPAPLSGGWGGLGAQGAAAAAASLGGWGRAWAQEPTAAGPGPLSGWGRARAEEDSAGRSGPGPLCGWGRARAEEGSVGPAAGPGPLGGWGRARAEEEPAGPGPLGGWGRARAEEDSAGPAPGSLGGWGRATAEEELAWGLGADGEPAGPAPLCDGWGPFGAAAAPADCADDCWGSSLECCYGDWEGDGCYAAAWGLLCDGGWQCGGGALAHCDWVPEPQAAPASAAFGPPPGLG